MEWGAWRCVAGFRPSAVRQVPIEEGQKSVTLDKQWAFSGVGELTYKRIFLAFRAVFAQNSNRSAPLAQLVEQRTFNPQVLGSSPRGRTFVLTRPGGRKRWLVRLG